MNEEEIAQQRLNLIIRSSLTVGLLFSALLLLAGMGMTFLQGGPIITSTVGPGEAIRQIIALNPSGFFSLGLAALIVTPFLMIASAFIFFLRRRDRRFVVVSGMVLFVMLLSILLSQV